MGENGGFLLILTQQIVLSVILLSGTYQCKVDSKGRLIIPSGLRKDLSSVIDEGFVLKTSFFLKEQPCLELYPMTQWNTMVEAMVKKLTSMNGNDRKVLRRIMAGVRKVEVDASGRILIPKDLIEVVGITKDIVLTGIGNMIELWDKEAFENIIEEDNIEELANECLGNTKIFDGIS